MKKIPMTSISQKWRTSKETFDELDREFHFDFDPCPIDPKFDGLSVDWGQSNYVNPPFKDIALWIKKGYEEYQKGKTVVFLIPSRTCTRWWHDYCMKGEIRFIKGRLKYDGAKYNAPFPSCVVIFNQLKERGGE